MYYSKYDKVVNAYGLHTFCDPKAWLAELTKQIEFIGDIERVISKVATARISPKEVVQLKRALNAITPIKDTIDKSENAALKKIAEQFLLSLRGGMKREKTNNPQIVCFGAASCLTERRERRWSLKFLIL